MIDKNDPADKPPPRRPRVSVQALAEAKLLPADFLRSLGVADRGGAVVIPYLGFTGEPLAEKRRTAVKATDGSRWPKGQPLAAYGSWRIDEARRAGRLYLVEGESDCWAAWRHGLPALGLPGAGAAATLLAEHVEAVEAVHVVQEPDQGGERFVAGVARRLADLRFAGRASAVRLPVKDLADLHVRHGGDRQKFLADLTAAVADARPLDVAPPPARPGSGLGPPPADEGPPSQSAQLLALAGPAELFHDAAGVAYACVPVGQGAAAHREVWPVHGGLDDWLRRAFYHDTGKAPAPAALLQALDTLEARARYDGPEQEAHVRLAPGAPPGGPLESICLDLGDDLWRAVVVTADGWRVEARPPARFRRPRGLRALPEPVKAPDNWLGRLFGGPLAPLWRVVNVARDDRPLVAAWLLHALVPGIPYAVLCLHGEHGSAKSSTARVLRSLIDPARPMLRGAPRDEEELLLAARHAHIVALDNLSHVEAWLSDALCRLATGAGLGKRKLYTDDQEHLLDVRRPVLLNGIADLAVRPDLLDRCLIVRLPPLADADRKTEAEHDRLVREAAPRVLGALLDGLAAALRGLRQPGRRPRALPRMADLALWATAAEEALGFRPGDFERAYQRSRGEAVGTALEGAPLWPALERFLAARQGGCWQGTCQELLTLLDDQERDRPRPQGWPRSPRGLADGLQRLAPALRRLGFGFERHRAGDASGTRLVTLTAPADAAGGAPSEASDRQTGGLPSDASDGPDGRPADFSPLPG
jgi:hypothetical protein